MLKKLFGFDKTKHNLRIEVLAGATTFLTMAYILAVNPAILSETGMEKGALFTTTAVVSIIATAMMAILAKLPFVLAPSMGLNAFFAYTVCLTMGYSWQFALTAVLIEGVIFIILTLTNLREAIVNLLPTTIKHSISAGIGLFIAFIGLQSSGMVIDNPATLLSLGDITSGSALLGFIGLLITSVLLILRIKGALLIGILTATLIGIPMGITQYGGVFSIPPSIEPIFFKFEFHNIFTKDMLIIVFTFLFVDMFDTIGTLVAVSNKAGLSKDGKIPNARMAFLADAVGTTVGAALGTSTTTTYVESAAGVGEGGRTGLTAFTAACCFLLALFFAPVFLAIPAAATAPVLILVGLMMLTPIKDLNLTDYTEAVPAFLCIIFMPLAYSISDGIVIGMISYVLINLLCGKHKKMSVGMYIIAALFMLKYFL